MKLKILITTETIGVSHLGKLYIGYEMILGYFIFRFKSWNGFYLSMPSHPLRMESLEMVVAKPQRFLGA